MTEPAATDTVLFDLDGTFADTLLDLGYALDAAMAERGLAGPTRAALRQVVSHGARAMTEHALGPDADAATLDAVMARFLDLYRDNVARHTRLIDGMQTVVARLDEAGISWGIVTNKRRLWAEPLMAALDPEGRSGCLVCGDTTANAKPHPQPLLHACRLMGAAPARSVYVGDAENDVVAARRAGMRSVVALYGYIADGDDPHGWRADATIRTPGELLAWLDIA